MARFTSRSLLSDFILYSVLETYYNSIRGFEEIVRIGKLYNDDISEIIEVRPTARVGTLYRFFVLTRTPLAEASNYYKFY